MSELNKGPVPADKSPKLPVANEPGKAHDQREKAESQEVVGRHKNDGENVHHGRR
jgi:hypothetical protein